MAIQTYVTENGDIRFQVYVNIRSKQNPRLRIQKRAKGLKTETEAKREELKLSREAEREIFEKETQGASWGALVEAWDEHLKIDRGERLNEVTRQDYLGALRKHTGSWWQHAAAQITKANVRECLNQMEASGASVSYQNKIKVILHRVFVFGMESGLIEGLHQSPAYGISLGRQEKKKPEILTITQMQKLLLDAKALNHPWYYTWAMAILTGMRNGELYALTWSDVDWENGVIAVTKSYNSRRRAIKSTKSGDWRSVPISSQLREVLDELKAQTGKTSWILPRLPGWEKGIQARELRKFCQGMGLPSVKFHTLRACFATQLIRNGVPPIQLQKICGWKDLETMQRYIRLAGIETTGATESLKVLPDSVAVSKMIGVFPSKAPKSTTLS